MAQNPNTSNFSHGIDCSDGTNGGIWCNNTQVIDADGTLLTAPDITVASVTTGIGLALDDNTALTSGQLVKIASSATAITGAGRLLYSNHTGATGTTAVLNEFASAANDETTILRVTGSDLLAAGVGLDISLAAMTTGTALDISNLAAITTGKAIHVDATGVTHTSGILVHIDSAATAITGAGRLFLSDHTGATGTSAILNEFKTAANDESVLLELDAASLTTGVILDVIGTAVTTGTAVDVGGLDALTTGKGLYITSNSADTGVGYLIDVLNDHASATGRIPVRIVNDSTGNDLQITNRNTGALGAKIELYQNSGNSAAADNDVTGRILFQADDEEASATKRTVGQIDCLWTDATAVSYSSRFIIYTSTGAAQNEAMRILDTGKIQVDLASEINTGTGAGDVFDDYDDNAILAKWSKDASLRREFVENLEVMGIAERKDSGSGWLINVQQLMWLLCGGINQLYHRMNALEARA